MRRYVDVLDRLTAARDTLADAIVELASGGDAWDVLETGALEAEGALAVATDALWAVCDDVFGTVIDRELLELVDLAGFARDDVDRALELAGDVVRRLDAVVACASRYVGRHR